MNLSENRDKNYPIDRVLQKINILTIERKFLKFLVEKRSIIVGEWLDEAQKNPYCFSKKRINWLAYALMIFSVKIKWGYLTCFFFLILARQQWNSLIFCHICIDSLKFLNGGKYFFLIQSNEIRCKFLKLYWLMVVFCLQCFCWFFLKSLIETLYECRWLVNLFKSVMEE